jgi:hypothetical protein
MNKFERCHHYKKIKDIPPITEITVLSADESHSNDFQRKFEEEDVYG